MAKERVYRAILNEKTFEKYQELGYFPDEDGCMCKEITLNFECDGPQGFIYLFNSKGFQDELKKYPNIKKMLAKEGIKFKYRQVVINDAFKQYTTKWILKLDTSYNNYIGLTSIQFIYPNEYFNKEVLDTYAKEFVDELLKNGLVEEIEVEE